MKRGKHFKGAKKCRSAYQRASNTIKYVMHQNVCTTVFSLAPRMISLFITFTVLSCSMQANLEEFVEEGLSLVSITSSSYSQDYNNQGIVENRSVLSGSPVTVNLEILNPEGLDLVYEIGYNTRYIAELSTIDPTGPGQNSVSFTFTPSGDADNQTIVFTIAIRSPSLNKIVERGIVSIHCVSVSNTDLRLQAILGDQNATYTFSGNGQTPAIMDLTTAGTLNIIPTAEVSGQAIYYWLSIPGMLKESGSMQFGKSNILNLVDDNVTYTLLIQVYSPDTLTNTKYSIKVPKGFTVLEGKTYTVADFKAAITGKNHIKLGGDITLAGPDASGPLITNLAGENFVFDGNGHKISNMRIDATDNASFIDVNMGIIENLTLENVAITSSSGINAYVAGLVGQNYGSIYRCSVSGTIEDTGASTSQGVGGLVCRANAETSQISECYNTATVIGQSYTGGIVGFSSDGNILNCYSRGRVSGGPNVGGLVGGITPPSSVSNSYATNASTGRLIGAGGASVFPVESFYTTSPISVPATWNITNTVNPSYVWGIGSGINEGYPYLQYFGAQTRLPPLVP